MTLWLHLLLRSGQNPQVKVETPRVPHINTTGGLGSSVWKITQHSMQTFQCEHCLKIEDNLPELDDLFSQQLSFCIWYGDEV